ncbi:sugar transferase [Erythrobacter sp. GH1-10]|uniref:sugar transferase n=1 Tax=Erythrobacter sp. GH1-10 TaxID=3349334 RepID=UPI003878430E
MGNLMSRIAAAGLLLAAAPLILVLALGVRISMGSPVLFRQRRAGLNGSSFVMLKLRSMRDSRADDGSLLPDELRVTAIGMFLRRSRLDELPGLWNIVRGELAFVGPRPLLPETIEQLGARGVERGIVRPGLTGWSQVNGNTLLSLDRKIELDLWYVENRNIWLDLQILMRTFAVMIFGERETRPALKPKGTSDRT